MPHSRFTHTSVLATDLAESVEWYRNWFGLEPIPTPDFDVPVQWLRCGDLQLHLFERDIEPTDYYHFGLYVDNFEEIYRAVKAGEIQPDYDMVGTDAPVSGDGPIVYELPDESIQMYIRDIAGNLLEINYHDVEHIDRDVVERIVSRDEVTPQSGEALEAALFVDELRTDIEANR